MSASGPATLAVPRLLTVPEVAEVLRCSRQHVYDIKHRIGFVHLGRGIRFRPECLDRFIAAQSENTPAAIARIDVRSLG